MSSHIASQAMPSTLQVVQTSYIYCLPAKLRLVATHRGGVGNMEVAYEAHHFVTCGNGDNGGFGGG
jgi:hypothetical protein